MLNKRNINLDLIRCIAVFSVLSVHFFLNNGFYEQPVVGGKMYVATLMRTAFMICVPLFIILTGFLMNKKELSKQYYFGNGIRKVIMVYVLSTLCILTYKLVIMKEAFSIKDAVFNLTSYQQYSWYIEMYIGLYLLIPFLNVLYHNLPGKKEKRLLCIVLLVLTTVPSFFNTFGYTIIPAWWTGIYPLSYYFIGAYLSEFHLDIKISRSMHFVLMVVSIVASGTYCYFRSYGTDFVWGNWCDWRGFTNVLDSFLVFTFFLRLDMSKWSDAFKKVIVKISGVSLAIYLVSWIFDRYAYSVLNESVEIMRDRIVYYLPVVLFVFICSFFLACLIEYVYKLIISIWGKVSLF